MFCSLCKEDIPVGTGGHANLVQHRGSMQCKKNLKATLEKEKMVKAKLKTTKLDSFFKKIVRAVSPKFSAPPPIHPVVVDRDPEPELDERPISPILS